MVIRGGRYGKKRLGTYDVDKGYHRLLVCFWAPTPNWLIFGVVIDYDLKYMYTKFQLPELVFFLDMAEKPQKITFFPNVYPCVILKVTQIKFCTKLLE